MYVYLQLTKVMVGLSKISKIVGLGGWQHATCWRVQHITPTLSLIPSHNNAKTNPKYNPTIPAIITLTLFKSFTKNFYTLDWSGLVLGLGLVAAVVGADSSR